MAVFRNNGATGALLDEYEKAVRELKEVLNDVKDSQLSVIVDAETTDPDCVSIQSILHHVLRAGYNYIIAIRNNLGENLQKHRPEKTDSVPIFKEALDQMFAFNEQLFIRYPNLVLETHDHKKKIITSWGQSYDAEQLIEHAIVHVLRHRRQIQRFLLKLNA